MRHLAAARWAALLFVALSAPRLLAHHSSAAYDLTKSLTFQATVAEIRFSNPHVMLLFDVKKDDGSVQRWAIETYNPAAMKRAGWTKTTLNPGDHVTITFHPAFNGTTNGYIREGDGKIVLNGRELNLNQTGDTAVAR
jgi:hypothetical protein